METTTISAKTHVREQTYKTLSRYGSPQLEAKINQGLLIGLSLEVAKEILEKRKVAEINKANGKTLSPVTKVAQITKDLSVSKPKSKIETPEVEKKPVSVAKIKAEVKSQETKEPAVKKSGKKSEVIPIDGNDPKVAAILAATQSKSDKIRALSALGYSNLQISAKHFPNLNAHYSLVCTAVAAAKKE